MTENRDVTLATGPKDEFPSGISQDSGDVNGEIARRRIVLSKPGPKRRVGSNSDDFRFARSDGQKEPTRVLFPIPTGTLSGEQFRPLKKFDGVVLECGPSSFMARVADFDSNAEEEAEFDYAELSPDDISLVKPGAQFYWSLGYEQKAYGQRIRCSFLRFRRMPKWSVSEIEGALNEARILKSFLNLSLADAEPE